MKRIALIFTVLLALTVPLQAFNLTIPAETPVEVHFSPRGGAQDALTHRIDEARDSVYALAYSFTSESIADALIRATLGVCMSRLC